MPLLHQHYYCTCAIYLFVVAICTHFMNLIGQHRRENQYKNHAIKWRVIWLQMIKIIADRFILCELIAWFEQGRFFHAGWRISSIIQFPIARKCWVQKALYCFSIALQIISSKIWWERNNSVSDRVVKNDLKWNHRAKCIILPNHLENYLSNYLYKNSTGTLIRSLCLYSYYTGSPVINAFIFN